MMNRKTAVFLIAFLALLIWVFFALRQEEPEPPPAVEVPGFLEDPGVAVVDPYHLNTDFTRVEITRLGEQITLVKRGEVWEMVTPFESKVDQGRVRSMFLPLQTASKSSITKDAEGEDLAIFGLDPTKAVSVTVYRGEEIFTQFTVGAKEERKGPEGQRTVIDTWIRMPPDGPIARINEKNFHDPFQIRAKDLRLRRLFSFTHNNIVGVEMRHPLHEGLPEITLRRDSGGKSPWQIVTPRGFSAGNIQGLLTAIAGLEATDYAVDIPESESGLGPEDDFCATTITLDSGTKYYMIIGKKADENVYARVTEINGETSRSLGDILIDQYTSKHLHRTIDDLREKKVLRPLVQSLRSISLENGAIVLEKSDGTWRLAKPTGLRVDPATLVNLVRDLDNWSITKFFPWGALEERGLTPEQNPTRVTLMGTEEEVTLLIGGLKDKVHWAMREGTTDEIWMITSFMASQLRGRTSDDFRQRQLFDLTRDDIAWVELYHRNESTRLERNPAATDPDNQWIVIRGEERNTKPKTSEVNYLLTSLSSLVIKSFPQEIGKTNAQMEEGAFHARFGLKSGETETVFISEMEPVPNEVYAHVPSQASWAGKIFTINKFQARNIQKKFKHFTRRNP